MKVTGIDLSFTSTGASRLVTGQPSPPVVARIMPPKNLRPKAKQPLTRDQWYERLDHQARAALTWCLGADLVAVEGPSYASPQGQHQLGGLWYRVTFELWRRGIPFVVITPTQVKQYALGKGSGPGTDKDFVLAAVVRRYPMVMVSGNDEADALVLSAMCADYYGYPIAQVPKDHRRAFDKVEWVPRERLGLDAVA